MTLSVSFDFKGITDKLDAITQAAEANTRKAAQAGAQVLYEEARQRAPVSKETHYTKGKKQVFQPGNLRAAIYQAFADDESGKARSVYRVSWNKRKAFYGQFVEFGTVKMAARPFIRPAYDARRDEAVTAVKAVMLDAVRGALNGR
ncbi:MAG: HK97-gp10 family putative phage morphogenesis protein [Burkholderiaceae bacterium]